jgi:hypothetical protein
VTAKSISVEKGGVFSGQLVIGSSGLQQAELLPVQAAPGTTLTEAGGTDLLPGITAPLPAT